MSILVKNLMFEPSGISGQFKNNMKDILIFVKKIKKKHKMLLEQWELNPRPLGEQLCYTAPLVENCL